MTLAHPAAGYPLRKALATHGSIPAFVIGSMVPDLPYFVPLIATGVKSHSLSGLLWFCLPAGLLTWALYLAILRPFALALLPEVLAAGAGRDRAFTVSLRELSRVGASVLFGAITHVVWDSFTHRNGLGVRTLPALRTSIPIADAFAPPVFTLLQHASTVLGLSVLVFWAFRRLRSRGAGRAPLPSPPSSRRRNVLLMGLLVSPLMAFLVVVSPILESSPSALRGLQLSIDRATITAGSVFLTVLVLTALAWRLGLLRVRE